MLDFTLGQRWISDSEPELGLGLIIEVEHRMVTVEYLQSEETRTYAKNSAPLSRISFSVGDEVHDRQQQPYIITAVEEVDGLLIYQVLTQEALKNNAPAISLIETALNDNVILNQPLSRLASGQTDHSQWFELRVKTLESLNFIEKSALLGLCSARTELIPHQLYIANEVAQRHAPRVLLADEVGLGKTIEACLILQQQLFSGQASRVLIIVPETLLHQWLVELLRRFNLTFSILDNERCQAILEDSGQNPFDTEQLILCSSELFIDCNELLPLALATTWDLLIVDEAHHLIAPPDSQSTRAGEFDAELNGKLNGKLNEEMGKKLEEVEKNDSNVNATQNSYENIKRLSEKVKGLILLTATPDQLGVQSHFSLLGLLDANRFHNYPAFVKEQENFTQIASLIEQLEALNSEGHQETLTSVASALNQLFFDEEIHLIIQQLIAAKNKKNDFDNNKHKLITAILDRHGTGRVLFRNSRKIISGFPSRKLITYPLNNPACYQGQECNLNPELSCPEKKTWLKEDPRIIVVEDLLHKYNHEKILLIAANKKTILVLEEFLRLHRGIKTSLFHEDMSIMERDRAAVYFSDKENGSQILLCSEIGSEGRNFQFSHHLILFDLPLNPDLLEQRIGRLDRIGQKNTIHIHVPYLKSGSQEKLFLWFHEGLNAFQKTNPAAFKVFHQLQDQLSINLSSANSSITSLLEETALLNKSLLHDFSKGRDRLLEKNSFNKEKSSDIINHIAQLESTATPRQFIELAFNSFGIDVEENSDQSFTFTLSDHMTISTFPGIPDQGVSITYQREIALHREDIQFMSWHHPIVEQTIDLILQGDLGKSAIAILEDKRLKSGSLLLESIYVVNIQAAKHLQLKRFMPTTYIRLLVDSDYRNLSKALSFKDLNQALQHVDKSHLKPYITENKAKIEEMSKRSERQVLSELPGIIKTSKEKMSTSLSAELTRLKALRSVNSSIRGEEIEYLENQQASLEKSFEEASLQLEAVRLIFVA